MNSEHRTRSYILVTIQFATVLGIIAISVSRRPGILPMLLIFIGTLIGIAAIASMHLGNFRIVPIPKPDAILMTGGLYRFIRHPMYTGLLITALGFAINSTNYLAYVLWLALLYDLLVKIRFEERLLVARFPDYGEYMTRSKRLVPFIW